MEGGKSYVYPKAIVVERGEGDACDARVDSDHREGQAVVVQGNICRIIEESGSLVLEANDLFDEYV